MKRMLPMETRRRHTIGKILGIGAVLLLAALFVFAKREEIKETPVGETQKEETVELEFEPEVLEYDGKGTLDLMEGVRARTKDGEDLTGQVQAVLTGDGTNGRKKIRYSVFSEDGEETTKTRTLQLTGYTGPSLSVDDSLELTADDLDDLVACLAQQKALTADDGFGGDASDQVTWVRQRVAQGRYEITFTLRNDYLDTVSAHAQASISGDVPDLVLELSDTSITIPAGSSFYPLAYVVTAQDPDYGDILSRVEVINLADVSRPGTYFVTYRLLSLDGTQMAEASMQVTVTGGSRYD